MKPQTIRRFAIYLSGALVVAGCCFAGIKQHQAAVQAQKLKTWQASTDKIVTVTKTGVDKLEEYTVLKSRYESCVLDVTQKPDDCREIAVKANAVVLEIQVINEQLNQASSDSYKALCDFLPTASKCKK